MTERPTFVLRLRSPPGGDPVGNLKWCLKRLADAGMTCTAVTEDNEVMSDQRLVKLCDMWQRKSAKGMTYFSGLAGPVQYVMFKDGEKPHPTRPDETVIVWKLLVQEKDTERRPKQAAHAEASESF